jgi:hypothetical protein
VCAHSEFNSFLCKIWYAVELYEKSRLVKPHWSGDIYHEMALISENNESFITVSVLFQGVRHLKLFTMIVN